MPNEDGVHYSTRFYSSHATGARSSAEVVVPLVMDLIHPTTVVDIGCGVGDWLAVFRDNGVETILGIDGDYVDRSLLRIPEDNFRATDLSQPFAQDRTFDLAMSLEVAEHLPASSAKTIVGSLTGLAPVVLFSAAIPQQGGTRHINEQWPEYWADLFKEQGYDVIDPLRRRLWKEPDVEWWYVQNTLIFVDRERMADYPELSKAYDPDASRMLSVVHPRLYAEKTKVQAPSVRARIRRGRQSLILKAKRLLPTGIYDPLRAAYRRTGLGRTSGRTHS